MPEAGLEPARSKGPRDFKSLVSTCSTTPAKFNDLIYSVAVTYARLFFSLIRQVFSPFQFRTDRMTKKCEPE